MSKHRANVAADSVERLRKALLKRAKSDLVDVLVELARRDRHLLRELGAQFELEAPPDELAAATRQAITDAAYFDVREINRNFSYDYAAYGEVQRNLSRLVALGQLPLAMELSLELMKRGSHQVEMSDEGVMTEDIQECLASVITALRTSNLPPAEVSAWCEAMLKHDRDGFICRDEVRSLQRHIAASRS